MTTVAFDGRTLAADRKMGGWMDACKIFKLKDGRYLAGAGYYDQIVEVVAWIDEGAHPDKKPKLPEDEGSSLLLVEEGAAYWLTWPYLRTVLVRDPFVAIGSGGEFALGAMAAGANARKAVEIACRFDPHSGKGVHSVKVTK